MKVGVAAHARRTGSATMRLPGIYAAVHPFEVNRTLPAQVAALPCGMTAVGARRAPGPGPSVRSEPPVPCRASAAVSLAVGFKFGGRGTLPPRTRPPAPPRSEGCRHPPAPFCFESTNVLSSRLLGPESLRLSPCRCLASCRALSSSLVIAQSDSCYSSPEFQDAHQELLTQGPSAAMPNKRPSWHTSD